MRGVPKPSCIQKNGCPDLSHEKDNSGQPLVLMDKAETGFCVITKNPCRVRFFNDFQRAGESFRVPHIKGEAGVAACLVVFKNYVYVFM